MNNFSENINSEFNSKYVTKNDIIKNIINNDYININTNDININVKTDDILISVFSNKDFYLKLNESFEKTIKYHNESREYYYIFNIPYTQITKRYSGKYIKTLLKYPYNKIISNENNIDYIDKIYYILIMNINFYMNIINSYTNAKKQYNMSRQYFFRLNPPNNVYDKYKYISKTYSSIEILNYYKHSCFIKKNKIYIPEFL